MSKTRKILLFFLIILLTLLIVFAFIKNNKPKKQYVYAIHSLLPYGNFSISQIEPTANQIIKEFKVNKAYDFISPLNDQLLLLTINKNDFLPTSRIDILDTETGFYKKLIANTAQSFSAVFTHKNKIFAILGDAKKPLWLNLYNKNGKLEKESLIDYAAIMNDQAFFINNNDLWVLVNQFHNKTTGDLPCIYIVDLNSLVIKKKIDLGSFFSGGTAISLNSKEKEIYISALWRNSEIKHQINTYIYVFSFPECKFLRKINVFDQTTKLCYISNYHKLYASAGKKFKVIDTQKNKLLKTFDFSVNYLSRKFDYLYLSSTKYYLDSKKTQIDLETKLLILNVKTDYIVNEFSGDYGPLSL